MNKTRRRPPGRPRMEAGATPVAETIMRTATRLFMEFGYEGVSVEQVAELCGVTKATVYYHYDNKASLFTKSVIDLMNRIRQHTVNVLSESTSLRDKLTRVAELRLSVPYAVHDFDGLMGEATGVLTAAQLESMKEAEQQIVQVIANEFERAVATGEIEEIRPEIAAHIYLALLMVGKARSSDGDRLFASPREAAEELVATFWEGIASKQKS
ncbi:TetR/AcrR family transcriptional regulator [Alicyclobacillus mengziensis]|uniref:TetR/AcrR family transcriptional regulator n=1 Tax=Alicyclobacillus mengziensis TaxID=2931921 RepID=A0A9X7Z921_9BACL|nr:TetR/AcrR family transcriptional regulator [Alicyclobacillus mengziensis]QSO49068.1 TetR/AcrR family transcriptional regulator [Alicyclobacillus mengziensis]